MKKKLLAILLPVVFAVSLLPGTVFAADNPEISSNINGQAYGKRATTVTSYLYENESGGLTRVEYVPDVEGSIDHDGGEWNSWGVVSEEHIVVEDYNSSFLFQSSRFKPMELDIWGGFFAGDTCNFLVFGQKNTDEDDSKEVIRVVKYSKDWQRLGQASLYGANTVTPL